MLFILGMPIAFYGQTSSAQVSSTVESISATVVDDDWNRVFTRQSGWTGADVAGSAEIGNGRVLWMFGDTWIGRVVDGRHAAGSHLVNNSIAVHHHVDGRSFVPPAPDAVQFYWGEPDKKRRPTAWVKPSPLSKSNDGQDDNSRSFDGWYWTTGSAVVINTPRGQRLCVFLFDVGKRDSSNSVWNFVGRGSSIAVIDNHRDHPSQWKVHIQPIPYAPSTDTAESGAARSKLNWGIAALSLPAHHAHQDQVVYIFGIDESQPLNKRLLVARVAESKLLNFSSWRFFARDQEWSLDRDQAVAIAEGATSELSVERVTVAGRTRYVMVHSEPLFGKRILVRTADKPAGPWSQAKPVYVVSDVTRHKSFFTYAAKGHAHLSRPGELLVSYLVNSHEFAQMVNDATIYRPRFIRVPLADVFSREQ